VERQVKGKISITRLGSTWVPRRGGSGRLS
jgi:hypothetical protein